MNTLQPEQLIHTQNWRYATKAFDAQKKISAQDWKSLEASLILSPSSYGLQPWKFIVVTSADLKKQLRTHSWNQTQVEDCSHYLIICAKESMDAKWVARFVDSIANVRGIARNTVEGYEKMMLGDVVNGPRSKVSFEWAARQCYIALGNFMTSAALLGIDTCPIEGFSPVDYDKVLKLEGTGWKSVVCCAAGFRSSQDKYASAKKVRFTPAEVMDYR
jgi:nitroreductase